MFPLTSPFTACSRRSCTSYEVQMETEATACVENTIIMTVAFTTQVGPDPPPFLCTVPRPKLKGRLYPQ